MTASNPINANGSRARDLSAALDNAIAALTTLDTTTLEGIEGSVTALLDGADAQTFFAPGENDRRTEFAEVAARHKLLGTLLASTDLNLNVLERLNSRNALGDTSWAR